MAEPLLVVGLGNPGPRYETTRHNLGFLVADILADRLGSGFKVHKKSGALAITGRLGGRSIVLAKPRVYMNESGRQVGPLANFYSVAPADVIVLARRARHRLRPHPAEARRRRGRPQRTAFGVIGVGHQGLSASADRHRPTAGTQGSRATYVLENFTAAERPEVGTICEQAADATELLIELGLEPAQNTVHAW